MIPEDVRRFVLTSVSSIPHLEALLLFHDHPDAARSVADVARALYVTDQAAATTLAHLVEIGCLQGPSQGQPCYRYMPRDAALHGRISAMAGAYRSDMIGITHLIHDRTQKNAHRFAEAFKLKREP